MITNEGSSANLKGLSTDTKPLDAPVNTFFFEEDTATFYYVKTNTDGVSADWVQVGASE
jgi:hypothetical protein